MKKYILPLFFFLIPFASFAQNIEGGIKYYNAENLMIINKGFDNTEMTFSRLPSDIKPVTRNSVWNLGLNCAGVAVRFSSDAKEIKARWTLLNNPRMNHMAATGICGLDIYVLDDKGRWRFSGTAFPDKKQSESSFGFFSGEWHEYMVYLPLYDGVCSLEIGIDKDSEIALPRAEVLVKGQKPILFYGTSITQGGCASRPGMVYTSILSRKWQRECVNLGFSGNARMDKVISEAISRIDADAYVIDCLPNCSAQVLRDSAEVFLRIIADAHRDTPIYMVENVEDMHEACDRQRAEMYIEKHLCWKEIYLKLRKDGYRNFRYIPRDKLSGKDGEESVDCIHRTDLGFMRLADGLSRYIKF